MGAKASRNPSLPFNPSDYEEVRPKDLSDEAPSYRVLKHIRTGMEMQEYRLNFNDEHDFNDFYDAFEWRLQQEYVVSTCYLLQNHRKEFCSTHYGALLYTERIPIKLSEIKDIPYPDNLYILYAALEGFHTVYHKTGFFQVQQHMVCINRQGRVKVWINDNLSRKYPESIYTQTDGSEEDMVRRIIELIEYNTDASSQPDSVQDYVRKHLLRPSFGDAKMLLRQYAKEHGVSIPRSFECILQVLNSEYNRTDITDSREEEFRTFHGRGSRHAPSVRSHAQNNIRTRSRRSDRYSHADSQHSHHSFHEGSLPKNRYGRPEVLNSRVNLAGSGNIIGHPLQAHYPPMMRSQIQQQAPSLLPMPVPPGFAMQGPPKSSLPVIAEGRQIIHHMHYPVVGPPPQNYLRVPPGAAPNGQQMLHQSVRPIFHSVNQQPQTIISATPSRQQIHYVNQAPRLSASKDRRLNIYSESEDSQLHIDPHAEVYAGKPRAYPQQLAMPVAMRVPIVMHNYNVGQPYTQPLYHQPYTINNNNIITKSEYLPQHQALQQHNIYDQEESVRSSKKQRSLSRSKKYNSDIEHSRSGSRKPNKRRQQRPESSEQSLTEEEYEEDRKHNRKKQQQRHYKKHEHVINEDEDDDEEEERIRRSQRRERRFREDHAKLKMYRDKEEDDYRRQKQEEEYRRRREEDEFRRRREEEEFRIRMNLEEQEHRQRKAQEDFQRRAAFEEQARRQRQREDEYLRQKHREQMEYNSRGRAPRLPSEVSSNHGDTYRDQHFRQDNVSRSNHHLSVQRRAEEKSNRQRDIQTFMYYSSDQDHQLDPEIARDLLVMQQM